MTKFKNVGGVHIEMTPEEIIELEALQSKVAVTEKADLDARIQKEADNLSGHQKLKDLGLTDDEISALVGGNT